MGTQVLLREAEVTEDEIIERVDAAVGAVMIGGNFSSTMVASAAIAAYKAALAEAGW